MPKPVEVGEPITDGNDRELDVNKGLTATLDMGGNLCLLLGLKQPHDAVASTFRIGRAGIGVHTLQQQPLPAILVRFLPRSRNGEPIDEHGDLRARSGLNLLQFESTRRDLFLQDSDDDRHHSIKIFLVETAPPGTASNLVKGIRDEQIRDHRMERLREESQRQVDAFDSKNEVFDQYQDLFGRQDRDQMFKETTLVTHEGKIQSPASEPI